MRVTKLYQNQKLLVWTRFSVPEFTEDYHLFPLEHVMLNLTLTKSKEQNVSIAQR